MFFCKDKSGQHSLKLVVRSVRTWAATASSTIFLFAEAERDVLVLDHVGDLASHGENKENDPIAKQDRPEHRNVKHREECHHKRNAECLCHRIPELELRETADERLELIRASGRKRRSIRTPSSLRINKRGQEPDEQIQKVDPKSISDDVEALDVVNPQTVGKGHDKSPNPPVSSVRRSLVEVMLVDPPRLMRFLLNRGRH